MPDVVVIPSTRAQGGNQTTCLIIIIKKTKTKTEVLFSLLSISMSKYLHLEKALLTSSSPDTGSIRGWKTGMSKTNF